MLFGVGGGGVWKAPGSKTVRGARDPTKRRKKPPTGQPPVEPQKGGIPTPGGLERSMMQRQKSETESEKTEVPATQRVVEKNQKEKGKREKCREKKKGASQVVVHGERPEWRLKLRRDL